MPKIVIVDKHIGIISTQKGDIYVYAKYPPRDYDWDFSEGTKQEIDYLCRCLKANKWLKR